MAALEPSYMQILHTVLLQRFVPLLPPLLNTSESVVNNNKKQLSRAFSAFALQKLLDITPQAAAASVVDDFNDKGIDAIHYNESTETLYLLQSKIKESEQFKQTDAHTFCEGIRLLIRQDFTAFNINIQNRQAEIENALEACRLIQLVVPYTGSGVSTSAIEALNALLNDESVDTERLVKQVKYYTAQDIISDLRAENAHQSINADITLQNYEKIDNPRTTYYGIAKLADLAKLHQTHGKALYERNIRYFLGSSNSDVNKAIKTTLHESPADFFYLNNGITAVCNSITPRGKKGNLRKFRTLNFSIINGAQTVASAAEFVNQNPSHNIDEAKVMLTLIQASQEHQFGKNITKARNHQNPVQTGHFASLDDNQERLRQEIAFLDFDYHYRPEVACTSTRAITLEEALRALALQHNDPRFTAWLKSEPGRLFNPYNPEYKTLINSTLTGTRLVNTVLYQRAIRDLIIQHERSAPTNSQERLLYRHGALAIAAVMIKCVRDKIKESTVVDKTAPKLLISQQLDILRQQTLDFWTQQQHQEGPLAYFRNQGNVATFLINLMITHFMLTNDPAIAPLRNIQPTTDSYPHARLFDYLSHRAPQL